MKHYMQHSLTFEVKKNYHSGTS